VTDEPTERADDETPRRTRRPRVAEPDAPTPEAPTPEAPAPAAKAEPRVRRYEASRLLSDTSILEVGRPRLAGAFADAGVADDDMLTLDEALGIVQSFEERPEITDDDPSEEA
jgi:hypothetical protein